MRIFFLLLTSIIFLGGCAKNIRPTEVIKETEIKYILIPDEYLKDCRPERPIDKEKYLSLDITERESYLTDYIIDLLKKLKECDIRIEKIRSLNETHKTRN